MWRWFSSFLLKPLVSRVRRRIPNRMDRFWRSTCDVLMRSGSGVPKIGSLIAPVHSAGPYLRSCPLAPLGSP